MDRVDVSRMARIGFNFSSRGCARENNLMVSSYFNGALMLKLDKDKPGATQLWRGNSESEVVTDTIHATMNQPAVIGDYLYGFCSYGQLRALKLETAERVWETMAVAAH